jgi:hypothetical protein
MVPLRCGSGVKSADDQVPKSRAKMRTQLQNSPNLMRRRRETIQPTRPAEISYRGIGYRRGQ